VSDVVPIVPEPVPRAPESPPALRPTHLHLWHAELDAFPGDERRLDAAERQRAAQMIPRVRRRFVASRCLLRRILGAYVRGGLPAAGRSDGDAVALHFETVGEGKPRLAPFAADSPRFNLSHADGQWLLAVSTREVGVDVERTDRRVDVEAVARRIFRPTEAAAILRESGDARRRAFFRAWTAREALVKARAEGMFTLSLNVEIRLEATGALSLAGDGAGGWTLLDVPRDAPWCAAVATAGRPGDVLAFHAR
jgi:4'-phosphopantetheinyl transferase